MKLLLDTHVLLWAAGVPTKLGRKTRALIEDPDNTLFFSVASLWEIAVKKSLGREDFQVDARVLRRELLDRAYEELAITSEHVLHVGDLPKLHKDPFDRILIAQAAVCGITLLTADEQVWQYPGAIRQV